MKRLTIKLLIICVIVSIGLYIGFAALRVGQNATAEEESTNETPWDVNQDRIVNVLDLVLVGQNFGTANPVADVNGDGTVNILDLVLVAQHFGETIPEVTEPEPGVPETPLPPEMVLIPAGEFQMGSDDPDASADERPVHTVYVDAFYMDKYKVTNAQYAEFLNAKDKHAEFVITWYNPSHSPSFGFGRIEFVSGVYRVKVGYENHPLGGVPWPCAMAYAVWKGKRLPTEAEWEKAARGGLVGKRYPNGDTITPQEGNYGLNVGDTTAVGSYPANGYGLYDMAGNLWEWCLDEYDENFYLNSPARNPLSGADSIEWLINNYKFPDVYYYVLRGGAYNEEVKLVRVSQRGLRPARWTGSLAGFRCVQDASD